MAGVNTNLSLSIAVSSLDIYSTARPDYHKLLCLDITYNIIFDGIYLSISSTKMWWQSISKNNKLDSSSHTYVTVSWVVFKSTSHPPPSSTSKYPHKSGLVGYGLSAEGLDWPWNTPGGVRIRAWFLQDSRVSFVIPREQKNRRTTGVPTRGGVRLTRCVHQTHTERTNYLSQGRFIPAQVTKSP